MPSTTATLPDNRSAANPPAKPTVFVQRVADVIELIKPRLVVMILITTAAGFYLGARTFEWLRCLHTLIGAGLTAAGVLGLNQYLERDADARMKRTQARPLPDSRMNPLTALLIGAAFTGSGMLYLTFIVNVLSGFVISLIVVSYLFLYTPLKRKTSLCTLNRSGAGCTSACCGLGCSTRFAGRRSVGAIYDTLFVATSALSRDRLYLS